VIPVDRERITTIDTQVDIINEALIINRTIIPRQWDRNPAWWPSWSAKPWRLDELYYTAQEWLPDYTTLGSRGGGLSFQQAALLYSSRHKTIDVGNQCCFRANNDSATSLISQSTIAAPKESMV
jgi:hypothetical protein